MQRRIIDDRIVAEAVAAFGLLGNLCLDDVFEDDRFLARLCPGDGTCVVAATVGDTLHLFENDAVLFGIRCIVTEPAGAVDAGLSVKGIDRKSGVIRQGCDMELIRYSLSLDDGIVMEGGAGFFGFPVPVEVLDGAYGVAVRFEHLFKFADFAGVAAGDDDFFIHPYSPLM